MLVQMAMQAGAEQLREIQVQSFLLYCSSVLEAVYQVDPAHELHETCHYVTFIVLVNSHQR